MRIQRSHSLPVGCTALDTDIASERRVYDEERAYAAEKTREKTWHAWLDRTQALKKFMSVPSFKMQPGQTLTYFVAPEDNKTLDPEAVDDFSQETFRAGLTEQVRNVGVGFVAEVTSAEPESGQMWTRLYDGRAWRDFTHRHARDLNGQGLTDIVTARAVTWVNIWMYDPAHKDMELVYYPTSTPPGGMSYLFARTLLDLTLHESDATWAAFGWMLGQWLDMPGLKPPATPPPERLAAPLLSLAAHTGDPALWAHCMAATCGPVAYDRARLVAAEVGNQTAFTALAGGAPDTADLDEVACWDFEEAAESTSWHAAGHTDGTDARWMREQLQRAFPRLDPWPRRPAG